MRTRVQHQKQSQDNCKVVGGRTNHDKAQSGLAAHPLSVLQRNLGNQAAQRLLLRDKMSGSDGVTQPHHSMLNESSGIVREALRSQSQPLTADTRTSIEARLGHDFSKVRVHTDTKAAESARAVNARAYTVGSDIVFGVGKYEPETREGQKLLTHELTHVMQQSRAVTSPELEVDPSDGLAEREAQHMANNSPNANVTLSPSKVTTTVLQRDPEDHLGRGRPGSGERSTSASSLNETGFVAWQNFIRERSRMLDNSVSMSPDVRLVEERTLERMREILWRNPRTVDRELPLMAHARIQREVVAEMGRQPASERRTQGTVPSNLEEFNRRFDPYQVLAEQLFNYRNRSERLVRQPWEQIVWLVRENTAVQDVLNIMGRRLMNWATSHIDIAHQRDPKDVLAEIASDPEIQALFRAAQLVPLDAESFSTAIEVPLWQRAARILWGFIPIVGDVTDLTEALSGWDIIEQRRLTNTERTILLVGALLPLIPGSALRAGREGATELATQLASRSATHSAAEFEGVIRAADAIAPQANQLRMAIQKIKRGERLAEQELQSMERLAHRIEESRAPATATSAREAARGASAAARTTRTIDRLALDGLSNVSVAERSALGQITDEGWERVLSYARSNRNRFSVKGKIAEELLAFAPAFGRAMARVSARAERMGIPANTVQFVRDVRGLSPTATHSGQFTELADGVIVSIQGNRVRILAVFESKSPSNLRELARRPGETLGQLGWDFERFSELPIMINGRIYQPEQVIVSRQATEWLGVAPRGFTLSEGQTQRIRGGLPGFELIQGLVRNEILDAIATRVLGLVQ